MISKYVQYILVPGYVSDDELQKVCSRRQKLDMKILTFHVANITPYTLHTIESMTLFKVSKMKIGGL